MQFLYPIVIIYLFINSAVIALDSNDNSKLLNANEEINSIANNVNELQSIKGLEGDSLQLSDVAWYPLNSYIENWVALATSSSGQYVYAASGSYTYNIPKTIGSIYVSTNYGNTWNLAFTIPDYFQIPTYVNDIKTSSSGQYVYAGVGGTFGGSGYLYRSIDYGSTWSAVNKQARGWTIATSSSGQYVFGVDCCSILTSSDYGVTWTTTFNPTYPTYPTTYYDFKKIWSSGTGQYVFLTSGYGSIVKSTDYGNTWTASPSNNSYASFFSIVTNYDASYIYVGGQLGVLSRSTDFGNSFSTVLDDYDSWQFLATTQSGQYVYAVKWLQNIFISSDYGNTWVVSSSSYNHNFNSLACSSSGQYVYAGPSNKVFTSQVLPGDYIYAYVNDEATFSPTFSPTTTPTIVPTQSPTNEPTLVPSYEPTVKPTFFPTNSPTASPTWCYMVCPPTNNPTTKPTRYPTSNPTTKPTLLPTVKPTIQPSYSPTTKPTLSPTTNPTVNPTNTPTFIPTKNPTSVQPTAKPTYQPLLMTLVCDSSSEGTIKVNCGRYSGKPILASLDCGDGSESVGSADCSTGIITYSTVTTE